MQKKKEQPMRGTVPQEPQPPMWAAVQELAEQVRQQAERIQALEQQATELKNSVEILRWRV